MKIFNSHTRNRFFLWVNITGLAIGLAVSIMLILFVVNELSYDRHFANHERIVRLLTADGKDNYQPINIRRAYAELPQQVSGIEATIQIYNSQRVEVISGQNRFQNVRGLLADPEIFKVFQMKFIEGTPETALVAPNSFVLTRRYADIMFGSPQAAMNQPVFVMDINFFITGVVEEIPKNSHFAFDILAPMEALPWLPYAGGLEFHTYYLIQKEASVEAVRTGIENAYRSIIKPWGEGTGSPDAHGVTEMLSDVYLNSKAAWSLGTMGSMRFIWILTALAFLVLTLAIANFINLFLTQGEMRMKEIAVRKTNGAQIIDIVRLFFSEVAVVVLIAFGIGFALAVFCAPHFAQLIGKNIDLVQLANPLFILAIVLLYIITVVLSASYPALYLSRFSPLEILGKRIRFSKRRLTAITVVFQSVISIILLSVILIMFKQAVYLERVPINYNPENVMSIRGNETINGNYETVRQELLNLPEIETVSGSQHHIFGDGTSGQVIAHWGVEGQNKRINEYRILTGMPELMQLQLIEGRFWQENDPDSIRMLILNEAAVRMLGGESPLEQTFNYWGREAKVVGVVKDFYYADPVSAVAPIALNRVFEPDVIHIRFNENVNTIRARQITLDVLQRFDPDFVLNPIWNIDIYQSKFKQIKTMTRIVLLGTAMSIFVAMLGLLAIHLYSAVRRRKEIGIRKILGASKSSVFVLLTLDVLKWIAMASVIAIPVAYYFISEQLSNYANRTTVDWTIFVLPVLIQCVIAILTTSGVTLNVLSQNPVKSLKSE
ncbi:MAG: ABC transporter permease [Dysgonamonadaceae bacterium]|nr:ABC transporter permease [Dysgonamonadaceae bacterium]